MPVLDGAQAAGCGPVAAAFEAGLDFVAPVRPGHDRQEPRHRQPGRRRLRARRRPRRPAASISAVTEEEIVEGIELLARTTGIFTETAGGVTTAMLAKLAARRAPSTPTSASSLYITGDGLKTLDAVASRVERHPIEPTVASFEAAMGEARLIA